MLAKEHYLTIANRLEKVNHWLVQCATVKSRRPFNLDPARAALLVLDMQNYFLDHNSHAFVPSGPAIIPTVNSLINWAKTNQVPMILTQHVDQPDSKSMMARWWGGGIERNTPAADLSPHLAINVSKTRQGDQLREIDHSVYVLTKHDYSAFYKTPLDELLRRLGISQLVVAGLMTHLCCETTTREAFMLGYESFFVVDATATYSESLHMGSLRAMAHGFAVCLAADEIVGTAG